MILKDPKDLLKWFDEYSWHPNYKCFSLSDFYQAINESPTIEAEPVRHGRWIEKIGRAKCSVCADECWADSAMEYSYCPNCGAKMDLEELNDG